MKRIYTAALLALLLFTSGCKGAAEPVPFEANPEQVMRDEEREKTADAVTAEQAQSKPAYDFTFDLSDKEVVSQSSGTGGTEWKGDNVGDSTIKVEKLSDVFYDGFNYIDYINREILRQLALRLAYEYTYDTPADEFIQKRAFSGIPRDYPYFELLEAGGTLLILFPEGNPFFNHSTTVPRGVDFRIELTKDISPYGKEEEKTRKIDYEKFVTEEGLIVLKPRVHDYLNKTADEAINRAAAELVSTILKDRTLAAKVKESLKSIGIEDLDKVGIDGFKLQPEFGTWKNYLCVNYVIDFFGGPYMEAPLVAAATIDITTGERADLRAVIPKDFDWSKCAFRNDLNGEATIKPQKLTDAWIRYNHYLCVNYVTADGTKGIAVIPLAELD